MEVSFDRAEVEPNISTEAEGAYGSGMRLGSNLVYAAMQMNNPIPLASDPHGCWQGSARVIEPHAEELQVRTEHDGNLVHSPDFGPARAPSSVPVNMW